MATGHLHLVSSPKRAIHDSILLGHSKIDELATYATPLTNPSQLPHKFGTLVGIV